MARKLHYWVCPLRMLAKRLECDLSSCEVYVDWIFFFHRGNCTSLIDFFSVNISRFFMICFVMLDPFNYSLSLTSNSWYDLFLLVCLRVVIRVFPLLRCENILCLWFLLFRLAFWCICGWPLHLGYVLGCTSMDYFQTSGEME